MEQCMKKYELLGVMEGGALPANQFVAKSLITGETCTMRQISKEIMSPEEYKDQIEVMRIIQQNPHPSVGIVHDIFEDEKGIFIFEEWLPKGDLLAHLLEGFPLSEEEIKKLIFSVVLAVEHLHKLNIVHRDVKLENVRFDKYLKPKLIDFELSCLYTEGQKMEKHSGTPQYCAPELVFRSGYVGPETDVWAIGVLLHVLIFGEYPFLNDEKNPEDLRKFVTSLSSLNYQVPYPERCPPLAASLLQSIFVTRDNRITLSDMKRHPWLSDLIEENKGMLKRFRKLTLTSVQHDNQTEEETAQPEEAPQTNLKQTMKKRQSFFKNFRSNTKGKFNSTSSPTCSPASSPPSTPRAGAGSDIHAHHDLSAITLHPPTASSSAVSAGSPPPSPRKEKKKLSSYIRRMMSIF